MNPSTDPHRVDLDIRGGEIFGIIGRSGAGKSTLIRCISLLERPTSGRVLVDGVDLTRTPNKDAIALEKPNSPFAVVVIASREDSKGNPAIAKLVRAYRSDDVKSSSRRRSRASW